MGFSTVLSACLHGIEVKMVHIEADISNGLPMFHMVGYLAAEVKEASERVKTALRNSNMPLPAKKIVVNFAPANMRKRGATFDLPVAVALLSSFESIEVNHLGKTLFLGELSLDGSIREVTGVLPIVREAKKQDCQACVIPSENEAEGRLVDGIEIVGVSHLLEVYDYLKGKYKGSKQKILTSRKMETKLDFADVKGQEIMKRATEVAVAGNHNILFIGPPGSSKSLLAQRVPSISPLLTKKEMIEVSNIYSIKGLLDKNNPLMSTRPFRSVHHTVTRAALVGGGKVPSIGELSLANNGCLLLEEIAEFRRETLEALRQPLEDKKIEITRSLGTYTFPANIMLVATMNPCPCGNYPDYHKCTCTDTQIRQYLNKISQPLLSRIDMCVEAPRVEFETLQQNEIVESSEVIRQRVCQARDTQSARYKRTNQTTNDELQGDDIEKYCVLDEGSKKMMKDAYEKLQLTARTYHKILKVARTVADLEGAKEIAASHLKEAISYRVMDIKYWRNIR